MRTVTTVAGMQRLARRWQRAGVPVGFVPTMGYLHAGHISLVHAARKRVGRRGHVVVSIYVNPTQFAPSEDLSRYPRDLAHDRDLCRDAGVDILFVPTDAEMYPDRDRGGYSTYVVEEALSKPMEGASRPTHFRGVTTIVAKLFNIVLPTVAVFGAKDYQQAAVLRRMVRDLNFPIEMIVAPTMRETDGLAMSSRNKYLNPEQRRQAAVLSEAIHLAQQTLARSPRGIPAHTLRLRIARLVSNCPEARLDYVEFFNPNTLEPVRSLRSGTHMALAVRVGKTRLIDNARLGQNECVSGTDPSQAVGYLTHTAPPPERKPDWPDMPPSRRPVEVGKSGRPAKAAS